MVRLIFFAMLLLPLCCKAQGENHVWYFGEGSGVTFASGAPVAIRGPLSAEEGTASICDASGALLFTTDGTRVFDRNLIQMPNGFDLMGGYSSTQSALIVPMPGSTDKYYIFTPGDLTKSGQLVFGFRYNIVDMSRNGGNGDVVQKNVQLLDTTAEKVAATPHCDGTSYWVVTHDRNLPRFFMFKVTTSGVEPPVVSDVGVQYVNPDPRHPGGNYGLGMLKFSESGRYLAMASPHAKRCEVFEVDLNLGVIHSPRTIDSLREFYGLSFSPNENIVYVATFNEVLQYNLQSGSIPSSRVNLGSIPSFAADAFRGGILRGPDDVIYVADGTQLKRIPSPNTLGPGCGYGTSGGVQLASGTKTFVGLPNVIEAFYRKSKPLPCVAPVADFVADSVTCIGTCITITNATTPNATRWSWTFEGGSIRSHEGQAPPAICYDTIGTFSIQLIAENVNGSDTTEKTIQIVTPPSIDAGPDISICGDQPTKLTVSGGVRYVWTPGVSVSDSNSSSPLFIALGAQTTLSVTGWNAAGCSSTDTIVVTRGQLTAAITPDTIICAGTTVQLQASGGEIYAWWPAEGLNATDTAIVNAQPATTTTYFAEVQSGACVDTVSVTIVVREKPTLTLRDDTITVCPDSEIMIRAESNGPASWYDEAGVLIHTGPELLFSTSVSRQFVVRVKSFEACEAADTVVVHVDTYRVSLDIGSASGMPGALGRVQLTSNVRNLPWQLSLDATSPQALLEVVEPGRIIADGRDGGPTIIELDSTSALLSWRLYLGPKQLIPLRGEILNHGSCFEPQVQEGSLEIEGCAIQRRSIRVTPSFQVDVSIYSSFGEFVVRVTDEPSLRAAIESLVPGVYILHTDNPDDTDEVILIE